MDKASLIINDKVSFVGLSSISQPRPRPKLILQHLGFSFDEDNYKLGNGRYSKVLKGHYLSIKKMVSFNSFFMLIRI